jgi:hypothetical protein
MSSTLYVFVDESGEYARGERYVVVGCWCLSNNEPRHIFDNARASLASHLVDSYGFSEGIKELKGTQLPTESLGDLLETFESFVYNDGTIPSPPYPWETGGQPFRFSVDSFHPDTCNAVLSNFMAEVDAPGALQMLALVSILDPLLHAEYLDLSGVERLQLVLDAEVWEGPAEEVIRILDFPPSLDVGFETRDSERTPGIQIADLAAYARRRSMVRGDCAEGNEFVTERWLRE